MYLLPNYIRGVNIRDNNLRYKWDDWNVEQAEEPIDEETYARLETISLRANIAFTIGTAEWIVHRFWKLCQDPILLQYLEAAWAQQIDLRYASGTWEEHTEEDDWVGPVRGPLGTAMKDASFVIEEGKESGDPSLGASWITNLAIHVIPDSSLYLSWRSAIIERLRSLYPRNEDEPLGEVIPMEILDLDYEFSIDKTEFLINQFLGRVDCRSNPLLSFPEIMLEEGFGGTPYVFDIERERAERLAW